MFKATLTLVTLVVLAVAFLSCGSDEPAGPRTRLVLLPELGTEGIPQQELEDRLDGVVRIIDRRLDEFELEGSSVERTSTNGIEVFVRQADAEKAESMIARTGLLQFCEPVINEAGDVAIVRNGSVIYEPGTCQPERDEAGDILTVGMFVEGPKPPIEFVPWARQGAPGSGANPRDDDIVWQPATGLVEGEEISLDSTYLRPNTFAFISELGLKQPTLIFEFGGDGVDLLELITSRLRERNYPLAPFLDGEPILDSNGLIVAPQVQAALTGGQGTITGLSEETAEELSILLNAGAFPIPLRIVDISEVID